MKQHATSTMSKTHLVRNTSMTPAMFRSNMVTRITCILIVRKEYCKYMHGLGLQENMSLRRHNEQLERVAVQQPNTQADVHTLTRWK
jgi:hypothetical protein